jgi:hypothetical protein
MLPTSEKALISVKTPTVTTMRDFIVDEPPHLDQRQRKRRRTAALLVLPMATNAAVRHLDRHNSRKIKRKRNRDSHCQVRVMRSKAPTPLNM